MNKNHAFFIALSVLESKSFLGNFWADSIQLDSTREFLGKKKRRKRK